MYDVQYGAVDPAAGGGEWFRPVRDGSFITSPLDSTATFPKQIKPILVTTVNQEAAYTIYTAYQSPQSVPDYSTDVGYSYSAQSTSHILNSSYYAVPSGVQAEANPDTRPQLQVLGTDGIWRCPAWTFAQAWSKAGGRAYVGEFVVGSTYADNAKAAPCTQAGVVCHQDDIEIVFGTVSNPTSAQAQAITEVQTRIASFVKTGNPNAGSYGTWNQATSSSVNAIQLGNNGASVAVAGCSSGFWGGSVPYDYQVYDL
jgi:carboxylesterase type B